MFTITVRDTFCGVKGDYVEEATCTTKQEADAWKKEWKSMYAKEDGYKITVTESTN